MTSWLFVCKGNNSYTVNTHAMFAHVLHTNYQTWSRQDVWL